VVIVADIQIRMIFVELFRSGGGNRERKGGFIYWILMDDGIEGD
jgi:hypothetical protein